MSIGGLLVLALVAWALYRSFNAPVTSPNVPQATMSQPSPPPTPSSTTASVDEEAAKRAVPRISVTELKQQMDRSAVTVIDVRNKEAYDSGHIKGAMHVPLASTESFLSYIPRDKAIVTYCT